MPSTIEQVHREHGEHGLVVLPINIRESRETVTAWAGRQRLTVPLLLDPDGQVTTAYGVTATPTAFLIGRDGRLVARAVGTKPWTSPPGRALLRLLLRK